MFEAVVSKVVVLGAVFFVVVFGADARLKVNVGLDSSGFCVDVSVFCWFCCVKVLPKENVGIVFEDSEGIDGFSIETGGVSVFAFVPNTKPEVVAVDPPKEKGCVDVVFSCNVCSFFPENPVKEKAVVGLFWDTDFVSNWGVVSPKEKGVVEDGCDVFFCPVPPKLNKDVPLPDVSNDPVGADVIPPTVLLNVDFDVTPNSFSVVPVAFILNNLLLIREIISIPPCPRGCAGGCPAGVVLFPKVKDAIPKGVDVEGVDGAADNPNPVPTDPPVDVAGVVVCPENSFVFPVVCDEFVFEADGKRNSAKFL